MVVDACALEILDKNGLKGKTKQIGGSEYKFITALKRKDTATELRNSLKSIGLTSKFRRDNKSGLYVVMVNDGNNGNSRGRKITNSVKGNAKVRGRLKGRGNKMNDTKTKSEPKVNTRAAEQSNVTASVRKGMPKLKILTSDNCSGCKQIEKSLANDIKANKISLVNVDTKEGREIADKLGAKYVPTFIIDDAKEVCILNEKGQKTKCVSKSEGNSANQGKVSSVNRAKAKAKPKLKMKKG